MRTKAERYRLRKAADRWLGWGLVIVIASMLPIALGPGWERASWAAITAYWATRVAGLAVFAWGHVLLCDSKDRPRLLAALALVGIAGTLVLYCVPACKLA